MSYLENFPNFIDDMIVKLNKYEEFKSYPNRFLIFLLDKEDNMEYINDVQLKLIQINMKLIILWSYEEASEFLKRITDI